MAEDSILATTTLIEAGHDGDDDPVPELPEEFVYKILEAGQTMGNLRKTYYSGDPNDIAANLQLNSFFFNRKSLIAMLESKNEIAGGCYADLPEHERLAEDAVHDALLRGRPFTKSDDPQCYNNFNGVYYSFDNFFRFYNGWLVSKGREPVNGDITKGRLDGTCVALFYGKFVYFYFLTF